MIDPTDLEDSDLERPGDDDSSVIDYSPQLLSALKQIAENVPEVSIKCDECDRLVKWEEDYTSRPSQQPPKRILICETCKNA